MAVKRFLGAILLACVSAVAQATPDIQHWVLDNGVRVYFVESHELPMVEFSMVFDAGGARDPRGKYGLAQMTAGMLEEGAGGKDADAIAKGFDGWGAQFSAGITTDYAAVSLRSLSDKNLLNPAVALYRTVLLQPDFPSKSLERERQRALIRLKQEQESPGDVANRKMRELMYGDHPYAHQPNGDVTGLQALQRADLTQFYKTSYVAANAVFVIVGDVSTSQAKALSREIGLALPPGKTAAALPAINPLTRAKQQKIAFPSSQTHIRMGQPGMRYQDPDYFPLYVGNYILGGGGFVSRLMSVIREKHGLSYSVYSYFAPMRLYGPYLMGLQTKTSQRDKALRLMRQTVQEFVDKGPTNEELDAAKKNLTGGFALRIDSNAKIRSNLVTIAFYQLPLDYLDRFIPRVEAVTTEQIRDAFRRRIDAGKMVTVIVGE